MTGSVLVYIPAAKVNLTGPVPQLLAAAFSGGRNCVRHNLGFDAWTSNHPGVGGSVDRTVFGHRCGDQLTADGGGLGQIDFRLVYAPQSTLEDTHAIGCRHCRVGDWDGTARDLWNGSAKGLPGDQLRRQHRLQNLLRDDVRYPADRGRPVRRARRILAQASIPSAAWWCH